jgi:hypothetical protein
MKMILFPNKSRLSIIARNTAILYFAGMSPAVAQVPILNSNPSINDKVIYLDFDGQKVSGTSWNSGNTVNAAASGLSNANKIVVWKRVSEDYRPFQVNVTTDSVRFNNASPVKRIRVVITPTSAWFGSAGGVAYVGSFNWGGTPGTPCWVFENQLGYNAKSVAEAAAHEVGHTLTLRHQSTYNTSCAKTNEYNPGIGVGVTSWAPIMGVGYSKNVTIWHIGTSATSCNTIQYDHGNSGIGITSMGYLNFFPDDIGNNYTTAKPLNLNFTTLTDSGLITEPSDIDVYRFTICSNRYVSIGVKPWALDTVNYSGADLDVRFFLYNSSNVLLAADTSLSKLHTLVGLNLAPGDYYFTIDGGRSNYYTDYGSLGKYFISIKATNPPLLASTVITNSSVCSGQNSVLNYTANGVPTSWLWTISGPSNATYSIATPTINLAPPGLYTITLLASSGTATSCPVMDLLNVQPMPVVSISGNQNILCNGRSATLTASGAASYTWLPTGFLGTTQVFSPTVTSTYTVNAGTGSCINPVAITVTVSPPINVFMVPSKTFACIGDTITFTAGGATTYTFLPGGSSQNPFITPISANTSYSVIGTFGNCTNLAAAAMTVAPDFTLNVYATDTIVCPGSTVTLTGYGANSYTFYPSGTTANPSYAVPFTATSYTIVGSKYPQCPKSKVVNIMMAQCVSSGLNAQQFEKGPLLFPNPVTDLLTIRANGDLRSFTIWDATGSVICAENESPGKSISTAGWAPGIYFITLSTGSGETISKFIVE